MRSRPDSADQQRRQVPVSGSCCRRSWLALVATLAVLGTVGELHAQTAEPLSATQPVPAHSRVDVSTLPPAPPAPEKGPEVKPFRTRDAEGLRQWKQRLQQSPAVVPATPGFVPDTRPDR